MPDKIGTPVKRYQNWCAVTHRHDLMEHEHGNWVKYSDYELVEKRAQEAERDSARLDHLAELPTHVIDNFSGDNQWELTFLYPIITEDGSETLRDAIDAAIDAARGQTC